MKSLVASALLACSSFSHAAILIYDDFSGSAQGATRTLGNTAYIQSQISSASPLAAGSGNYLATTVTNSPSGYPKPLSYAPVDLAHSWEALAGSVTVNNVAYTTLSGGFDMYFRVNSVATMTDASTQQTRVDTHFLRPVDIGVISGTPQAIRLILEGTTTGQISLSLQGLNAGMFGTSAGTFGLGSRSIAFPNYSALVQSGDIHHMGFTFDTNLSTGQITMSLFLREGTEGIDTTSADHRLGTISFYMSDTIARGTDGTGTIFGGLRNWDLVNRDATTGDPLSLALDYDGIRLQSGTVTRFEALGVPEPTRWLTACLGVFALLMRRKRR